MNKKPPKYIIITLGDPAGIGPYVAIKALQKIKFSSNMRFILVGSRSAASGIEGFRQVEKKVDFVNIEPKAKIKPGKINKASGIAAWEYLQAAVSLAKKLKNVSLVTAPVSKEAIQKTVPSFKGHTEFLAQAFKAKKVAMLMWGKRIRGITLTRHIPLSEVSSFLKRKTIIDSILLGWEFLDKFNKGRKIVLASFNPHAGINTYLGREEKTLLSARRQAERIIKCPVFGPLPAEGIFRDMLNGRYSLVISPYHDQLMVPFKLLEFEAGVNITLGLPIYRFSPVHGTAQDIVNKPQEISCESMQSAIKLALRI